MNINTNDLIIAYVSMGVVSVLLAVVAATKLYSSRRETGILLITLAVVCMFAFMTQIAGQLYLAHVVKDSAAIVWTNLAPLLAALAAGWILRLDSLPKSRRGVLSVLLGCGALVSLLWPTLATVLRPPPLGESSPTDKLVMQSDWATCSPAAAATLLRFEGIEASEAEMIPLCLTDSSGTPSLGLYRGLKLVAKRQGRDIVLTSSNLEQLWNNSSLPALLLVELPTYGVEDPRYVEEWGWVPGLGHSVVALAVEGDGIVIADPSVGLERWTREDLELLWHGQGLKLTQP